MKEVKTMKIQETLKDVQEIVEFAKEKGWSEKELLAAIELLHPNLQKNQMLAVNELMKNDHPFGDSDNGYQSGPSKKTLGP